MAGGSYSAITGTVCRERIDELGSDKHVTPKVAARAPHRGRQHHALPEIGRLDHLNVLVPVKRLEPGIQPYSYSPAIGMCGEPESPNQRARFPWPPTS